MKNTQISIDLNEILKSVVHIVKIKTPDFEEINIMEKQDRKKQRIAVRKAASLKEEIYRQRFRA